MKPCNNVEASIRLTGTLRRLAAARIGRIGVGHCTLADDPDGPRSYDQAKNGRASGRRLGQAATLMLRAAPRSAAANL